MIVHPVDLTGPLGRVVIDTDSEISLSRSNKRREMVVFPAPDGDDKTSIIRAVRSSRCIRHANFDILDLFAQLFDGCFQCETDPRQLHI